ncbi:MAG: methionine adenosyltransferase [Desulfurivibrio sp.]|jgi:S-adenosylmethionine synthetase|nr:MAG: methionine adenosyltransferase [Desulfurivibrio sp.]
MKKDFIFTSESVTEGHPDKICDQIVDTIVDRFLQVDPLAYVDAECAIAQAMVFIAAQFSSTTIVGIPLVAREVISQAGYNSEELNGKTCTVLTSLKELPPEVGRRLDESALSDDELDRIMVRHQVNAFGYACTQTPAFMPLPIWLAHKLARRITAARYTTLPFLAPDGKTQVSVQYRGGRPCRIHSLTLQICFDNSTAPPLSRQLEELIMEQIIEPAFFKEQIVPDADTRIHIETDNTLVSGGPMAHFGLSGRKTAIDTYGEFARNSGSALSGKSPVRIDRIGTYMARYAAKNIVAAGLADECELQLSYSVGLCRPVSVQVETFGTGRIEDSAIATLLNRHFDFRPFSIIKDFKLRSMPGTIKGGFYRKLAAYGQVGRMDIGLPWEMTDKAPLLREELRKNKCG